MLEDDFEKAVKVGRKLKLEEFERMRLFALYMQSTRGDAGAKPSHDEKTEEWQIWSILRGFGCEETKRAFIKNVRKLMVHTFSKHSFAIKFFYFAVLLICSSYIVMKEQKLKSSSIHQI